MQQSVLQFDDKIQLTCQLKNKLKEQKKLISEYNNLYQNYSKTNMITECRVCYEDFDITTAKDYIKMKKRVKNLRNKCKKIKVEIKNLDRKITNITKICKKNNKGQLMLREVITVHNVDTREWFFANHHSNHGLGQEFVPVTQYLPFHVVEREGIEDGIVDTIEKARILHNFQDGSKEVINPLFESFCLGIIKTEGLCEGFCQSCPILTIKNILFTQEELKNKDVFCTPPFAMMLAEKYLKLFK